MTFVLADRINETSTIVGTGDITLDGAVVSFAAFSDVMANTDTTYYVISQSTGDWEVGIGTYNSGPNTLTRTTVLQSTNADALVNFGVGTKSVFISQPADKAVYLDASDNLTLVGPDVFVTGGDVTITGETHTRGIAIQNANGLYNDGGDTGYLTAAGGDNTTAGGSWTMYGSTHATKASDIEFSSPSYSGANIRLHWDYSSLTWDFKASKILTTGTITTAPHYILEQAAAGSPTATFGQLWVKNDTPNTLWFTDDAGTDFEIGIDWKAGTEAGFHSLGIDDNASEEVFQMSDTEIILGGAGLPAAGWFIYKLSNTGHLFLTGGGASSNQGAQLTLYGGARATLASDLEFKADVGVELYYDHSASSWDFQANALITTGTVTSGPHFITEQAAADADVAGDGQFWVQTNTPNLPMFTDDAGTDFGLLTTHLQYAISDETTALTAADDKLNIRLPHGLYLTEVRASCNTAPTGATLIFDIEEAGVTVLSTLLTIDATETTSTTAAVPAVISDPNLADDALISFNIDQVGSSVAGTGAKITLIGYRTT
jgi:hypothetical protein